MDSSTIPDTEVKKLISDVSKLVTLDTQICYKKA